MSLLAPYRTAFNEITALYHLQEYTVNRSTKTVRALLSVYKDPKAREAHKAANLKTEDLNRQILEKRDELGKAGETFAAMSLEERKAQRDQFDADRNLIEAQIHRLQVGANGAVTMAKENQPGDVQRIDIPAGAVALDDDGNVDVADIYAWLKANVLKDAKDA